MPMLSERLLDLLGLVGTYERLRPDEACKDVEEAARLLVPYEQPEVAELLRRAAEYEGGCAEVVENAEALATDLCRWAAALVKLAEARATVLALKIPAAALCFILRCSEFEHPRTARWSEYRQTALAHVEKIEAALAGAGGVSSAEMAKGSLGA